MGLLLLLPAVKSQILNFIEQTSFRFLNSTIFLVLTPLLMGLLFYFFPIAKDYYGDSFIYAPKLNQIVNEVPKDVYDALFNLHLRPASARKTLLAIITLFSFYTGTTFQIAFKWVGIICGVLFILTWLTIIKRNITVVWWKIVLTILGISAPFLLIFHGHMDTYAIVYLALLIWLFSLLEYFKKSSNTYLYLLLIGLLICIKLHPLTVLLGPGYLLIFIRHYFGDKTFTSFLYNLKGIGSCIILPLFLAGGYLYFFVFEDHYDERLLQNIVDFDRLFLPLFSPEPPLDRYNLLSINHFIDFFNVLWLWSPAAWFVFIISLSNKIEFSIHKPEVTILGMSLFLFSAFLFMINPLISMPMDWDLFSIPAVIFLVFIVAITSKVEDTESSKNILPYVLSLTLFTIPIFVVNSSNIMLSYRLESIGKWVYRTYYEWSPRIIHSAIGLIENDADLYLKRKKKVIEDLKPYALIGKDVKFAMLYTDNAIMYDQFFGDTKRARKAFEDAYSYAPNYEINLILLTQNCARTGDFRAALKYAKQLIKLNPTSETILFNAALYAFKSGLNSEAIDYCNELLKINSNHKEAKELLHLIQKN